MTDMRSRAIALARQGFRVFPLAAGTKDKPIVPPGFTRPPKGKYQDLIPSSDPEVVARMWTNGAGPIAWNIGINTNDLLVVDVDNKNGKYGESGWIDLVLALGLDQYTIEARTPTGGRHLFYHLPEGVKAKSTRGLLGTGIDTRSWHGYVVAPGSKVAAGEYIWVQPPGSAPLALAPDKLLRLNGQPSEKAADTPEVVEGVELDTPETLARARDWLLYDAPEAVENDGGDATTFRVACRVKDFGISQQACLDLLMEAEGWNEVKAFPPWSAEELEQKVENAYAYGSEPIGARAPEAQFEPVELIENADSNVNLAQKNKQALSWCGFTVGREQFTGNGNAWLVKKYLGANELSVLYGDSNTGKTFLALDIAYRIATGLDWCGRKVSPGLVVYVAAEAGRGIFARLEALWRLHQPATEPALAVVPCLVDLFSPNADLKPLLVLLAEIAAFYGAPIVEVTVDTLARAIGPGDENSARDMGVLVRALDRIRVATGGAHVMVVHHSGKNKANGARGSSALRAATDTELEVENGQVIMRKQRNGEIVPPIGFRLVAVELGKDADGDSVTSCTVEVGAAVDFAPRLTGEQQEWVDQLRDITEMLGLEKFTHKDMRSAWAVAVRTVRRRTETLMELGEIEVVLEVAGKETIYRWAGT